MVQEGPIPHRGEEFPSLGTLSLAHAPCGRKGTDPPFSRRSQFRSEQPLLLHRVVRRRNITRTRTPFLAGAPLQPSGPSHTLLVNGRVIRFGNSSQYSHWWKLWWLMSQESFYLKKCVFKMNRVFLSIQEKAPLLTRESWPDQPDWDNLWRFFSVV